MTTELTPADRVHSQIVRWLREHGHVLPSTSVLAWDLTHRLTPDTTDDEAVAIAQWCGGSYLLDGAGTIAVPTPAGNVYADDGDKIIRHADGHFTVEPDPKQRAGRWCLAEPSDDVPSPACTLVRDHAGEFHESRTPQGDLIHRWPVIDPAQNCYCGGPEEIYPHRRGTGRHCRKETDRG